MFNLKGIFLSIIFALVPYSALAHECYNDFREIGKNRIEQNKNQSAKLLEIIEALQKTKKIDFESALNEYKRFSGNDETKSIDARIDKIDEKSTKLNSQIKVDSGEKQCLERMKLEQERSKLASQKFEAIKRALVEN